MGEKLNAFLTQLKDPVKCKGCNQGQLNLPGTALYLCVAAREY